MPRTLKERSPFSSESWLIFRSIWPFSVFRSWHCLRASCKRTIRLRERRLLRRGLAGHKQGRRGHRWGRMLLDIAEETEVPRYLCAVVRNYHKFSSKLGPDTWQSGAGISGVGALQEPDRSEPRAEAAAGLQPPLRKAKEVRKGQKKARHPPAGPGRPSHGNTLLQRDRAKTGTQRGRRQNSSVRRGLVQI